MCVGPWSWRASFEFQSCYECYDGCAQAVQSARGHLCTGDGGCLPGLGDATEG